jgi:hypothetical protein
LGEYQLADCADGTNFKLGRESGLPSWRACRELGRSWCNCNSKNSVGTGVTNHAHCARCITSADNYSDNYNYTDNGADNYSDKGSDNYTDDYSNNGADNYSDSCADRRYDCSSANKYVIGCSAG